MKPVLFELGGLELTSYGASKALAALVAWVMLASELRRRGRDPEHAYFLVLWALLGGFAGAKLYYLAEHAGSLSLHELGGTGFTWFGGLLGGAAATAVVARKQGIPLGLMAGMAAAPLAVAYGVGRLGCLLAGDGTYGTPSDLPWAMSFPEGHGTDPRARPSDAALRGDRRLPCRRPALEAASAARPTRPVRPVCRAHGDLSDPGRVHSPERRGRARALPAPAVVVRRGGARPASCLARRARPESLVLVDVMTSGTVLSYTPRRNR